MPGIKGLNSLILQAKFGDRSVIEIKNLLVMLILLKLTTE